MEVSWLSWQKSGRHLEGLGVIFYPDIQILWLHAPQSSFHRNEWDLASMAVSRFNYDVLGCDS